MKEFISENHLIEFLEHEGKQFLDAHRSTGKLAVAPGKEIYYELYCETSARGVLVLCHGYTETCTKYHELIYYFLRHGYHVLTYDQRGHGRSFREVKNPHKIHAQNFDAEYVEDLNLLVQKIAKKNFPSLPLFLYGHSMGGCVAARYIETYPKVFSRCILSSPMFGIHVAGVPSSFAFLLARLMKRIGCGKCYTLGQQDFQPDEKFKKSNCTSAARFNRYNILRANTPEFMLGGGDYSWLHTALCAAARAVSRKETAKIKTPVLLLEAECDAYVPRRRIAKFRKNLPGTEYHAWRDTKHEIYNSKDPVVRAYCRTIFQFLEKFC